MKKQEVLDSINSMIVEEYGNSLTMQDKLIDSGLDSLGMSLFLIQLDSKFGVLADKQEGVSEFDHLDIENLTVRDLVNKCVLLTTQQSTEQSH